MKPSSKNTNLELLILSFILMMVMVIDVVVPIYPNDLWPYMRIAEEILKSHAIPTTEFMTYTQYGQPASYLFWLPSLMFLGVYKLGGAALISVLSSLCLAVYHLFLWLTLREHKVSPLTAALAIGFSILVSINGWSVRPQILVFPLFGILLFLLARWRNGNTKLLWLLPVIACLWANFHASFIIFFFLTVPALLFFRGNRKRLGIFVALSLLATLINYYGFDLWKGMFGMVDNATIRQFSAEWIMPTNEGWQQNIFFFTLLAVPLIAAVSKTRLHLLDWVWYIGFGWMAVTTIRYQFWFMAVVVLVLARLAAPTLDPWYQRIRILQNRSINLALSVILLLVPIAFLPGIRGLWWSTATPVFQDTTPIRAAEWLKTQPQLKGELWSHFNYNTYLTYGLPERKLFMTNRFEDFPVQQFKDNNIISFAKPGWEAVVDDYGINLILASREENTDLLTALSAGTGWHEVYSDDTSIIFARD